MFIGFGTLPRPGYAGLGIVRSYKNHRPVISPDDRCPPEQWLLYVPGLPQSSPDFPDPLPHIWRGFFFYLQALLEPRLVLKICPHAF